MDYIKYLKIKLNVSDPSEIVEEAVKYLGTKYPERINNVMEYEIVDNWCKDMLLKWKIEFRILNLSKTDILGKLEPKYAGFIINLNKRLFTTQKRFTIAHEIAHVLSYDTFSPKWPQSKVLHSFKEEYYCDKIARAILLPRTLLDYKQFNLNKFDKSQFERIKEIWPKFKVSPWQIIKKLYEESSSDSIVCVYWQYIQNESNLRILDSCKPKGIFIPKKKHIYLNNMLKKWETNKSPEIAYNSNDLFSGIDLINIGSFYKKELFCSAFPIKTKAGSYVIQIINMG